MTEKESVRKRSVEEIAGELQAETDPARVTELAEELGRVLKEEEETRKQRRTKRDCA